MAEKVISDGLPDGVVLNVNVPYLKENELKGTMITRQGLRVYRDALDERIDRAVVRIIGSAAKRPQVSTNPAPISVR